MLAFTLFPNSYENNAKITILFRLSSSIAEQAQKHLTNVTQAIWELLHVYVFFSKLPQVNTQARKILAN